MNLNKIFKIIISIVLAIISSIFVTGLIMKLVATFEIEMIPRLSFMILLIAVPLYILIYASLFKNKKK